MFGMVHDQKECILISGLQPGLCYVPYFVSKSRGNIKGLLPSLLEMNLLSAQLQREIPIGCCPVKLSIRLLLRKPQYLVLIVAHNWISFRSPIVIYIYLIDRVRGPYWENIGPRSWQYGPSHFGEVRTRETEGRYSPSTARANSVNKRFITRLLVSKQTRTANATSIQRAKIAEIKLMYPSDFLYSYN